MYDIKYAVGDEVYYFERYSNPKNILECIHRGKIECINIKEFRYGRGVEVRYRMQGGYSDKGYTADRISIDYKDAVTRFIKIYEVEAKEEELKQQEIEKEDKRRAQEEIIKLLKNKGVRTFTKELLQSLENAKD